MVIFMIETITFKELGSAFRNCEDFENTCFEYGSSSLTSDSLLQYDYEIEDIDKTNFAGQINKYAADNWEFVDFYDQTILLKRPRL